MQNRTWIITSFVDGRTEELSEADAKLALTRAVHGMDPFEGFTDASELNADVDVPIAA